MAAGRSTGSAKVAESQSISQSEYLADWSQRDESWDLRRETADSLSRFFASVADADVAFQKYAARLGSRSGRLLFRWVPVDDGVTELRLQNAQFCRVRLCPICMWRRSLMWLARFLGALPGILAAYPTARWVHLTLTIKNPDISDLGGSLDVMNQAWHRLIKRKEFSSVLGWIRSTEVTRGNDGPMQCHPHYHVLLLVSPGYFGKGYISQKGWRDLWRSVARLDYDPSVNVKAVTANRASRSGASDRYSVPDGVDPALWANAIGGALEVLKYSTKPADLFPKSDGDPWLVGLTKGLHKRRLIAAGGVPEGCALGYRRR